MDNLVKLACSHVFRAFAIEMGERIQHTNNSDARTALYEVQAAANNVADQFEYEAKKGDA